MMLNGLAGCSRDGQIDRHIYSQIEPSVSLRIIVIFCIRSVFTMLKTFTISCIFYSLLLAMSCSAVNEILLHVTSFVDAPSNITLCDPDSINYLSNMCNLRSALGYCSVYTQYGNICRIALPFESSVPIEPSLGKIELDDVRGRIFVLGNASIIYLAHSTGENSGVPFLTVQGSLTSSSNEFGMSVATIAGFGSTTDNGGAINIQGVSAITFTNMTLSYNIGVNGGAVYISRSFSVSLSNCEVSNNYASSGGGGIYVDENCDSISFRSCRMLNNTAADGGALFLGFDNRNTTVSKCEFTSNSATVRGGAIFVDSFNSGVFFTDGTILRLGSAYQGGGLYVHRDNVAVLLLQCSLVQNFAELNGGGLFVDQENEVEMILSAWIDNKVGNFGAGAYIGEGNEDMAIANCTFSGNAAATTGGGVYVFNFNHRLTFSHSTFESNTVQHAGGGIFVYAYNYDIKVQACEFRSNRASFGGAFDTFEYNYLVVIEDSLFFGNLGGYGGAVMLYRDYLGASVTGCRFVSNVAQYFGGALYLALFNNNVHIARNLFSHNVGLADGGAIFIFQFNLYAAIEHCHFLENTANYGGGVFADNRNDYISVYNCSFSGNMGHISGGGILLAKATRGAMITSSSFTGHGAGRGGAVMLDNLITDTVLTGLTVADNYASSYGGGICIGTVNRGIIISNCTIRNNSAVIYGGGVHVNDQSSAIALVDSHISGNEASYGGGLMVFSGNIDVLVRRCMFWRNVGMVMGGAVSLMLANQDVTIADCHFMENSAWSIGGAIYVSLSNEHLWVSSSVLANNSAPDGGGAVHTSDLNSKITFDLCDFTHNRAEEGRGGGVFSESDGFTLRNSNFSGNQAVNGGAIYAGGNSITLEDLTIEANRASSAGGALFMSQCTNITILRALLLRNYALRNGGNVMLQSVSDIHVRDSSLQQGLSERGHGGGLYASFVSNWLMYNTDFLLNKCNEGNAGAVYVIDVNNAMFTTLIFDKNEAWISGGAFVVRSSSNVSVVDCVFRQNAAQQDSGSAMWITMSHLDIVNNLYENCSAPLGGGAVFWVYSETMRESPFGLTSTNTFFGNTAGFGADYATTGMQLAVASASRYNSSTIDINEYNEPLSPVNISLLDFYGQVYVLENTITVEANEKGLNGCNGRSEQLTGATIVQVRGGIAQFSDLYALCIPGGKMGVIFSAITNGVSDSVLVELIFRTCKRGEYYVEGTCTRCAENSYSLASNFNNTITSCEKCNHKAQQCYGDQIILEKGYWRLSEITPDIFNCLYEGKACGGGNETGDGLCKMGYEGPLCATCSSGYYYSNVDVGCRSCPDRKVDTTALLFVIVLVMLVGVLVFAAWRKFGRDANSESNEYGVTSLSRSTLKVIYQIRSAMKVGESERIRKLEEEKLKAKLERLEPRLKVYIAMLQILSSMNFNLTINFPPAFAAIIGFCSWFNLNFTDSLGVSCFGDYDYFDKLYMATLTPIGVSIFLLLAYAGRYTYLSYHQAHSKQLTQLYAFYMLLFLVFIFVILPGVSSMIIRVFSCTNLDPENALEGSYLFMDADYSISCNSDRYRIGRLYAVGMLFLYPIGMPMLYFALLYSVKNDIMNVHGSPNVGEPHPWQSVIRIAPFKFLYDSYLPQYWYWEIVETARKITLTGLLVVGSIGTSLRIVLSMLACMGCIKLYGYHGVYDDHLLNGDAELAQYQVFFVLFLTLLVNEEIIQGSDAAVGTLFIVILVGPFALLFCRLLLDIAFARYWKNQRLQEKYLSATALGQCWQGDVELQEVEEESSENEDEDVLSEEQDGEYSSEICIPLSNDSDEDVICEKEHSRSLAPALLKGHSISSTYDDIVKE